MKLATYFTPSGAAPAVIAGDKVFDIRLAAERERRGGFSSLEAIIESGDAALDTIRRWQELWGQDAELVRSLNQTQLLAPLPQPAQIRDFCPYPLHIKGAIMGMQRVLARLAGEAPREDMPEPDVPTPFRERPVYYKCNRFSVVGHDAAVVPPKASRFFDFELELGVVVGKRGAGIAARNASDHVFGYCLFNDFSARDIQKIETQAGFGPAKGKDFDTGNAIGPWIVTADEIPDPHKLTMKARVNGETWCESSTAGALHTIWDMIEYVSEEETLHPGEILGAGTVNRGCGLELDRFLKDGDVVEIEAQGIGVLRNVVRHAA